MNQSKWARRLTAALVVGIALGGVALAAGQGTQSDPLVTLSYLTDRATPAILSQVDQHITQRESTLKASLEEVARQYVQEVEAALSGASTGTGTSAAGAYRVVNLTAGQQLIGSEGCEFLLRSGSAQCVSDSAPGLVDMTAGGTLASGGSLVQNHLYLGTIDGRGVKAISAVTLLVRGSYTIS